MKQSIWKWFVGWFVALAVGCYTAFVAANFWDWFAVPVLHVSSVSFLQMLGLMWLISLFTGGYSSFDDPRWKILGFTVELCVPDEKRQDLKEFMDSMPFIIRLDTALKVFGQLAGNTFMLAAGFALHTVVS